MEWKSAGMMTVPISQYDGRNMFQTTNQYYMLKSLSNGLWFRHIFCPEIAWTAWITREKKASDRFRSVISQFAGHRTGGPSLPNCFMSWIDFRILQESNLQENLRWLTSWLSIKTIKRLWEGMTELYHYRHDEKHVPTDGRWSSSVLRVRGMKRRGFPCGLYRCISKAPRQGMKNEFSFLAGDFTFAPPKGKKTHTPNKSGVWIRTRRYEEHRLAVFNKQQPIENAKQSAFLDTTRCIVLQDRPTVTSYLKIQYVDIRIVIRIIYLYVQ